MLLISIPNDHVEMVFNSTVDIRGPTEYECLRCGTVVTSTSQPLECSRCGGGLRNRSTSME
ncbi:MAG: rubrerythrin-like domain-containing protein [Halodesulfurarchaeum sp.]